MLDLRNNLELNANFDDIIHVTRERDVTYWLTTERGQSVEGADARAGFYLRDLIFCLTPTQEGSGAPTPSNARPIVGTTVVGYSTPDGETVVSLADQYGEVFGGYYDCLGDKVIKTWGIVDLSSLSWTQTGAVMHFFTTFEDWKTTTTPNVVTIASNGLAEKYTLLTSAVWTGYAETDVLFHWNKQLYYMGGEVPSGKLCYELAEPVVIHGTEMKQVLVTSSPFPISSTTGEQIIVRYV